VWHAIALKLVTRAEIDFCSRARAPGWRIVSVLELSSRVRDRAGAGDAAMPGCAWGSGSELGSASNRRRQPDWRIDAPDDAAANGWQNGADAMSAARGPGNFATLGGRKVLGRSDIWVVGGLENAPIWRCGMCPGLEPPGRGIRWQPWCWRDQCRVREFAGRGAAGVRDGQW